MFAVYYLRAWAAEHETMTTSSRVQADAAREKQTQVYISRQKCAITGRNHETQRKSFFSQIKPEEEEKGLELCAFPVAYCACVRALQLNRLLCWHSVAHIRPCSSSNGRFQRAYRLYEKLIGIRYVNKSFVRTRFLLHFSFKQLSTCTIWCNVASTIYR